ncbi:MAG: hypothetical protein M1825_004144 [Sarcosagium campestre]|nr:MAG: hypothetical protein M1825_004144 [Sarcosagium campestre]
MRPIGSSFQQSIRLHLIPLNLLLLLFLQCTLPSQAAWTTKSWLSRGLRSKSSSNTNTTATVTNDGRPKSFHEAISGFTDAFSSSSGSQSISSGSTTPVTAGRKRNPGLVAHDAASWQTIYRASRPALAAVRMLSSTPYTATSSASACRRSRRASKIKSYPGIYGNGYEKDYEDDDDDNDIAADDDPYNYSHHTTTIPFELIGRFSWTGRDNDPDRWMPFIRLRPGRLYTLQYVVAQISTPGERQDTNLLPRVAVLLSPSGKSKKDKNVTEVIETWREYPQPDTRQRQQQQRQQQQWRHDSLDAYDDDSNNNNNDDSDYASAEFSWANAWTTVVPHPGSYRLQILEPADPSVPIDDDTVVLIRLFAQKQSSLALLASTSSSSILATAGSSLMTSKSKNTVGGDGSRSALNPLRWVMRCFTVDWRLPPSDVDIDDAVDSWRS